ncbi:DUF493 family protein YbeD [Algicola sagamiensis]|uniref:DUF493 family protein YbeD n=1 Tax=Algicola sagamiensis TaxID=163869 RepID=UPI0003672512|nr:DUF493 family protein YbeD [Algicola sagamiensis]
MVKQVKNTKFDEYLEFPCPFTFKIMGVADEKLPEIVMGVLQKHAPGEYSPTTKPSSKGTYLSITVSVTVKSKEHIETLYTELGNIDLVRYVL